MRAEREDIPEYLKTRKQGTPWKMLAMAGIGTGIVFSAVSIVGMFGNGTANNASNMKDGRKAVEEIASIRQGRVQQPASQLQSQTQSGIERKEAYRVPAFSTYEAEAATGSYPNKEAPRQKEKQTVFNDRNYIPQGAVNVISYSTLDEYAAPVPQGEQEILIIGKEGRRLRDFCPYKPGTIEHRNCKMNMDLYSRNRN